MQSNIPFGFNQYVKYFYLSIYIYFLIKYLNYISFNFGKKLLFLKRTKKKLKMQEHKEYIGSH